MPRGKTKSSTGRRKIEIKPIEDQQARHVCFSKRKNGVFSKASELATLCGAELALVMFSPAEHPVPYTFGSPAVEPVIDRLLSAGNRNKSGSEKGKEAVKEISGAESGKETQEESLTILALRQTIQEYTKKIEKEKAKKVGMKEKYKGLASRTPENKLLAAEANLSLPELEQLREALSKVKLKADKHIAELKDKGEPSSSDAPLAATPIRSWNPSEPGPVPALPDCKPSIPKVETAE